VSPSYTRDYPLVIARGERRVVEDVDGNVFLDCTAGIAVTSTGHSHPDVVAAITEQAQKFLHMSGTDFYYELQVAARRRAVGDRADARAASIVLQQLRHRGQRSGAEAREVHDRALQRHRFLGAFHGRSMGSLSLTASKVRSAGIRSARAGHVSTRRIPTAIAVLSAGRDVRGECMRSSRSSCSCTSSRPTKWRRSSSSRFRARAATSSRRQFLQRCASSATQHGIC
jgi:4-aminobutyrate aminotransferase-like enzyme